MGREAKILIGILVVVVGGMIALFALGGGGQQSPSVGSAADASKLTRASSHKTGSGSLTFVEFGDYQCPACGAAEPIVRDLKSEYNGRVTFVFRNFPLSIHPNAPAAAAAAEAAGLQGKFWQMHDKLYDTQKEWSDSADAPSLFAGYAQSLGLDVDKFKSDSASQAVQNIINDDKSDGTALNIQGTPTIFVNGQQSADYTKDTLKKLIDEQLKK